MIKKVKRFLSLRPRTQLFFIEAYISLGWARILKSLPFSKVAPKLGASMSETSASSVPADFETIRTVSIVINVMSKYTFWQSMCLVRAIAGMQMLRRRGIPSTLYLGTAKSESGKLMAHAWLRSGQYYISGAEEMAAYTTVAFFGNEQILIGKRRGQSDEQRVSVRS